MRSSVGRAHFPNQRIQKRYPRRKHHHGSDDGGHVPFVGASSSDYFENDEEAEEESKTAMVDPFQDLSFDDNDDSSSYSTPTEPEAAPDVPAYSATDSSVDSGPFPSAVIASASMTQSSPSPTSSRSDSPDIVRLPQQAGELGPRMKHRNHNSTFLLLGLIVGTVCLSVTATIIIIRYLRKRNKLRSQDDQLTKQIATLDYTPTSRPHDDDETKDQADKLDIISSTPNNESSSSSHDFKGTDPMSDPTIQENVMRRMAGISTMSSSRTSHRISKWNTVESWIRKKVRLEAEKQLDGTSNLSPSTKLTTTTSSSSVEQGQLDNDTAFKHPLGTWGGVQSWGPESQYWKKESEQTKIMAKLPHLEGHFETRLSLNLGTDQSVSVFGHDA